MRARPERSSDELRKLEHGDREEAHGEAEPAVCEGDLANLKQRLRRWDVVDAQLNQHRHRHNAHEGKVAERADLPEELRAAPRRERAEQLGEDDDRERQVACLGKIPPLQRPSRPPGPSCCGEETNSSV
jgi:hypothetical protein